MKERSPLAGWRLEGERYVFRDFRGWVAGVYANLAALERDENPGVVAEIRKEAEGHA